VDARSHGDAPVVYRDEVLGIIGALADIVVATRQIVELLGHDGEEEEQEGEG
jgi:hypothetical protein